MRLEFAFLRHRGAVKSIGSSTIHIPAGILCPDSANNSMHRHLSLSTPRGLAAAAVGWACGFALAHLVGFLMRIGERGAVSAIHFGDWKDMEFGAVATAAMFGATAFASYAPPGRHRLISTAGLVVLFAFPLILILLKQDWARPLRGEDHWVLEPIRFTCVTGPALVVGLAVAVSRSLEVIDETSHDEA